MPVIYFFLGAAVLILLEALVGLLPLLLGRYFNRPGLGKLGMLCYTFCGLLPGHPVEAGTLSLWLNEPASGGISCGSWAGFDLLAGLLAAGAAAAVIAGLRRRKKSRPAPDTPIRWAGTVTVEKLHEQGGRSGQQDCFFVSPAEERAGLLAVVADGMGGLSDGDKVSQTAVSAMA